jgi:hypothetical protein
MREYDYKMESFDGDFVMGAFTEEELHGKITAMLDINNFEQLQKIFGAENVTPGQIIFLLNGTPKCITYGAPIFNLYW